MNVIEKEVFISRMFRVQGSSHKKKNSSRECKLLETIERLRYLFISPTNVGLPQKIKTEYTDSLNYTKSETRY